ncbi:MAG: ribonuclease III [Mucispirillum sp.]|nr:ribonuclease III [Mucispirillum sp.]
MRNNSTETFVINIEKNLGYVFRDKGLLTRALTHSSYSYDNNLEYDYERLEFLGDAVMELIITEHIVLKYKDFREGDLSMLRAYMVNESSLYKIAGKIDIHNNILLGKSEFNSGDMIKQAIIADIFEAVIAAVYLDGGYDIAKKIVLNLFDEAIDEAVAKNSFIDSKTLLQQLCQKKFGKLPEYSLVASDGPEHDKTFVAELNMCGVIKTRAE